MIPPPKINTALMDQFDGAPAWARCTVYVIVAIHVSALVIGSFWPVSGRKK